MSARRVTIGDIARVSEASPTTVSLVLREKPGIGPETRERVLAAAHSLGYRRRPSHTVKDSVDLRAVALLFRARTRSASDRAPGVNAFYSWVLTGLEASARVKRMNLLYATLPVDEHNQISDLPRQLLEQSLDGILVVGPFPSSVLDGLLDPLGVATVIVDGPALARSRSAVVTDNLNGALDAVRYLIAQGHLHIGLISPAPTVNANFDERSDGYHRAMREAGLTPHTCPIEDDDVASAVQSLLTEAPETTAIFAVNDIFAINAIRAIVASGRRVPESISVMGFDDIDLATQSQPGLTTMTVDKMSMGRLAIELLDFRMTYPDAAISRLTLSPRLVVRQSVGPPRT